MMYQWIALGIGYVGAAIFALLWKLEQAKHKETKAFLQQTNKLLQESQATIKVMMDRHKKERTAYEQLQKNEEKLQEAINNLPDADHDDLMEFMSNNSSP
jgi:uncharacterized protein HemX